jgi:hypothetical protein
MIDPPAKEGKYIYSIYQASFTIAPEYRLQKPVASNGLWV